jgi:hypothetical protein
MTTYNVINVQDSYKHIGTIHWFRTVFFKKRSADHQSSKVLKQVRGKTNLDQKTFTNEFNIAF